MSSISQARQGPQVKMPEEKIKRTPEGERKKKTNILFNRTRKPVKRGVTEQ